MLCVRTCISSEDVRAAVVGKSRIMAEHIRKLSSVQGKGLFRKVLEFCLGLAKKLGFVTRESDDGSYGVCETGEGEKTYIINIHLGKRKAEDERESSVVNDYAGPAVCILYSLSICRELSGRIPFRIQVCFLPEDDGFLDCCIPAAGKLKETVSGNDVNLVLLEQSFPKDESKTRSNCVLHTDSEFKALQIAEEAANYSQQMGIFLVPAAEGDLVRIDSIGGTDRKWSEPWSASDATVQLSDFLATLPLRKDGFRHHTFTVLNTESDSASMIYAMRDSVCELTGKGEIWRSYYDLSHFLLTRKPGEQPLNDENLSGVEETINWSMVYVGAFLRLAGRYKEN